MPAFVALIRGINVGRAKQVPMEDLRSAVEAAGFEDVRTVLRSGNVLLRGTGSESDIAGRVEQAIAARLRVDARVIVRTLDELAAIVQANPIPEAAADGARLHVMFLERAPSRDELDRIGHAASGDDVLRPVGREIYVWYRNGMAGSDTAGRLATLVKTGNTDRNWNTLRRLLALAGRG